MKRDLYELLPAYYRVLDSKEGEPLKALFNVLSREYNIVADDIAQMYENWFIETCEEWIVPYIGDLLGVRSLHPVEIVPGFSQRAFVANTIAYRRRKGTAPILEQLALDITGWRARVVEFFELLGTTQNINHIRINNMRTPDLHKLDELELLDTAFDTISHTIDVRPVSDNKGWYNIPNIGLFIWRIESYPLENITPCKIKDGCFTFNPLGVDISLFNNPATETQITHLAEEINVPGILRRRPLCIELKDRRLSIVQNKDPYQVYFNPEPGESVLSVFEGTKQLKPEEITISNLEDWNKPGWIPPLSEEFTRPDGSTFKTKVTVDPVLGRMVFLKDIILDDPSVSYSYGFSGDIGGGPYDRSDFIKEIFEEKPTWQAGVKKNPTSGDAVIYNTIRDAIDAWNSQSDVEFGIISIMDNSTYDEDLTGDHTIIIKGSSILLIVAAGWPETDGFYTIGNIDPNNLRPHIRGNISIKGTGPENDNSGSTFIIDGLLIEGNLSVLKGNLGSLQISNSTIAPPDKGVAVNQNTNLTVNILRSITGQVKINMPVSLLTITDSIICKKDTLAISAIGTPIELHSSTIFGEVEAKKAEISDCIITEIAEIEQRQQGCVRFSFLPVESKVPRRYRCQPELEIGLQISQAKEKGIVSELAKNKIRKSVLGWLIPGFTSTVYGHYGFAQLSGGCPSQILTGAENGSEMGVFGFLKQPQRETNLKIALEEYLRLGLEAGIIYVT